MTYHGQNISRTAMFLACKTENAHQSVESFAANFSKITSEQILAPEYLIVQALRFNFEIKHPFRGLKGGHLELVEMARGSYEGPNCLEEGGDMTSADLAASMLKVEGKNGATGKSSMSMADLEKRITDAYGFASRILKTTAQLTDAYFLYTPSQIWLAAHLLADTRLTQFYLSVKLPSTSPTHTRLFSTLRACANLLKSHRTFPSQHDDTKHKAEVKRLIEKLKSCRDPDKVDLVKLNQAQKRDADGKEGGLEEGIAKRRKVERETYEKASDSFWGPELGQAT
jgi:cyclin H